MTLFRKLSSSPPLAGDAIFINNIIDNLNCVLNTKKGYGSFLADFGIRDMNEYSSRDQLAAVIMGEVKNNIERYESRLQLTNISLEENNDPFRISFKIECVVKETQRALFMEFNSVHNDFHIRHQ
jgi:type VI secretion system lysozyme-like protein